MKNLLRVTGAKFYNKFQMEFASEYSLVRCDDLFPQQKTPTYVNEALNQKSQIDYFLISFSCQQEFCFSLPSVTLARRTEIFLSKIGQCENLLVKRLLRM